MSDHHLPDEILFEYATGAANEAHALLCAVHLTYCERCRSELELLETVGGALVDGPDVDAIAITPRATAPRREAPGPGPAEAALPEGAAGWPRPLHPYVRGRAFHWHAPGAHVLETALVLESMPVRIFRLRPGMVVPRHTHRGSEALIVLSGGFVDRGQHYGRGDVATGNDEVEHELRIDAGEVCHALTVNEHPLIPRTWYARLIATVRRS